jgi:hypothetical protein
MRRCAFLALIILTLPSIAHTEQLTLHGGYQTGTSGGPPSSTPKDVRLDLFRFIPSPSTILTQAVVHNVFPSNNAQIWQITAANAGAFDLDWDIAQAAIDECILNPPTIRATSWLGNAKGGQDFLIENINNTRVISFDLQTIELELTYWVNQPLLVGHRNVWRITGDAVIVPEPSDGILTIGIVIFGLLIHGRARVL